MIQSVRDATLSILLARCLVFPRPVTSIQCAKSTIPLFLKKAEIGQGWPKDGIKSTARSAKAINSKLLTSSLLKALTMVLTYTCISIMSKHPSLFGSYTS